MSILQNLLIRVLVLSDGSPVMGELMGMLEQMGLRLWVYTTGPEALAALRHRLDLDMAVLPPGVPDAAPPTDCYELCHWLRNQPGGRAMPVLFLEQGTGEWLNRERAFAAGATDYIAVPLLPAEVEARVLACQSMVQLRQHRGQLRVILDAFPGLVFYRDLDGHIIDCNEAFAAQITGLNINDVRGEKLTNLSRRIPIDANLLRAEQTAGNPDPGNVVSQEIQVWCADGVRRDFTCSWTGFMLDSGRLMGTIGVLLDVSQQKLTQQTIEAALRAAEDAARARSAFLANMSHEIRTPMNAVVGTTSLLLLTNLTAEQRDYVETVHDSGRSLLDLLNDILDFSRIESARVELAYQAFDLWSCVQRAVALFAAQAGAQDLQLLCDLHPDVPQYVLGDEGRVRQILVNLISNALKFTEIGEVVVQVNVEPLRVYPHDSDMHEEEDTITQRLLDVVEIVVDVQDTGVGISPEWQERIFEPFRQVEGIDGILTRPAGGTGLGLAISRQLATMMHGSLTIQSTPGAGSTFTLRFRAEVQPAPPPDFLITPQPVLDGKTVLLIDSYRRSRALLQRWLVQWGVHVLIPDTLIDAPALLQAHRCDLLMLDEETLQSASVTERSWLSPPNGDAALPMVTLRSPSQQKVDDTFEVQGYRATISRPVNVNDLHRVLLRLLSDDPIYEEMRYAPILDTIPLSDMRVLLVEDNVLNQKVVLRLIEKLGYDADLASTGREAVAAVKRNAYDLVFMDVQMPDMDGVTATRLIRRQNASVHQPIIVALTAQALAGDREWLLSSGMDDYLSKPVTIEQLRDMLIKVQGKLVVGEPASNETPRLETPDIAVLDEGVLMQVLESLDMVEDFPAASEFLMTYVQECNECLVTLNRAFESGDQEVFVRAAHTLKGMSAQVGALRLAHAAAEIEEQGQNGHIHRVIGDVQHLQDEYTLVQQALDDLLARLSQGLRRG